MLLILLIQLDSVSEGETISCYFVSVTLGQANPRCFYCLCWVLSAFCLQNQGFNCFQSLFLCALDICVSSTIVKEFILGKKCFLSPPPIEQLPKMITWIWNGQFATLQGPDPRKSDGMFQFLCYLAQQFYSYFLI